MGSVEELVIRLSEKFAAVGVSYLKLVIAFEDRGMVNDPGWNHFV